MDAELVEMSGGMHQIGLEDPGPENKDRLTTLPAELRNRIYDLVVPRGYVWTSGLDDRGFRPRSRPERTTPAVSRTCRIFRR